MPRRNIKEKVLAAQSPTLTKTFYITAISIGAAASILAFSILLFPTDDPGGRPADKVAVTAAQTQALALQLVAPV